MPDPLEIIDPIHGRVPVEKAVGIYFGEDSHERLPDPEEIDIGYCQVSTDDESVRLAFGRRRAGPEDLDYGSYYEFDVTAAAARQLAELLLDGAADVEETVEAWQRAYPEPAASGPATPAV